MRIFGLPAAEYYVSSFTGATGDAEGSVDEFQRSNLGYQKVLVEGSPLYTEYRDCSLRDVERSLFFAASHYRRSLDLMLPSASPWAQVSLYYGSWYASRALLAMFGCTVFLKMIVDVERESPGQQALRVRKIGTRPGQESSTYRGSHRRFWDFFYRAMQSLAPMVDARFGAVLSPVSQNPIWQIEHRNRVNYDTCVGLRLALDFRRLFSQQKFPSSLPGMLNTQFRILEKVLELVYSYADEFELRTDALNALGQTRPLREKVRALIYADKAPGLVRKTRKALVT